MQEPKMKSEISLQDILHSQDVALSFVGCWDISVLAFARDLGAQRTEQLQQASQLQKGKTPNDMSSEHCCCFWFWWCGVTWCYCEVREMMKQTQPPRYHNGGIVIVVLLSAYIYVHNDSSVHIISYHHIIYIIFSNLKPYIYLNILYIYIFTQQHGDFTLPTILKPATGRRFFQMLLWTQADVSGPRWLTERKGGPLGSAGEPTDGSPFATWVCPKKVYPVYSWLVSLFIVLISGWWF